MEKKRGFDSIDAPNNETNNADQPAPKRAKIDNLIIKTKLAEISKLVMAVFGWDGDCSITSATIQIYDLANKNLYIANKKINVQNAIKPITDKNFDPINDTGDIITWHDINEEEFDIKLVGNEEVLFGGMEFDICKCILYVDNLPVMLTNRILIFPENKGKITNYYRINGKWLYRRFNWANVQFNRGINGVALFTISEFKKMRDVANISKQILGFEL